MRKNKLAIAIGILSLGLAGPLTALAGPNSSGIKSSGMETSSSSGKSGELKDAKETIRDSAKVVEKLKTNPDTRNVLSRAKGVFIVPNYSRAALGVGGAGGEGVLVAHNQGNWSPPAFYNVGSISLGLQAGIEHGQVAFLIMSDKAMQDFRDRNNFSLNADAGLSIINWSKRAQASTGEGADVIAWTATKGLYGDLAVSVTDIFWDGDANRAYYRKNVAANDIFTGSVKDPLSSSPLEAEFSALEAPDQSGGDSGGMNQR